MSECQHPNCRKRHSDTYRGENGNRLRVCEKHYWELVTDKHVPVGITGGYNITSGLDSTSDTPGVTLPYWTAEDEEFWEFGFNIDDE